MSSSDEVSGAQLIALTLKHHGVTTIFGLIGIPVIEVAAACIDVGIRFIGGRNEQAMAYAACAYGYMTGKPGVCLVVGGPGVIHAMAGTHHSTTNAWPLLLLAGSSETFQSGIGMGAFQELDQVGLLHGHVKFAARPPSMAQIPFVIEKAFRTAFYGKPGPSYVDLPADFIQGSASRREIDWRQPVALPRKSGAALPDVKRAVNLLLSASRPLIVLGKGAQYAQAETAITSLLSHLPIPFLPTPMGKGLLPDTHNLCIAAARSTALSGADVVLVLGARMNWILHYGKAPKWSEGAKFIRVDIEGESLDDVVKPEVGLCGDVVAVVEQLVEELSRRGTSANGHEVWVKSLKVKCRANQEKASKLAILPSPAGTTATGEARRMTYHQIFNVIKPLLPASHYFIGEGANTMDIARSIFDVHEPRSRLDAGSQAAMGVGMGFCIAAALVAEEQHQKGWTNREGKRESGRRKVVAVLGDSAFGFSGMEIETAARNRLGMLVVVMNNGGVYKGLSPAQYAKLPLTSLPPTALLPDIRYDMLATACGPHGQGFLVATPEELATAIKKGLADQDKGVVTIVNVLMDPGGEKKLEFGWLASTKKAKL